MLELAGAVIFDENNKILLIHRNTEKIKQWELPGGKIEKGESSQESTIRELKEELNIDVEILEYLGSDIFSENNNNMNYYWYKCIIKNGKPKLMEPKFDIMKYFSKEELVESYEQLSPNMKKLLKKL